MNKLYSFIILTLAVCVASCGGNKKDQAADGDAESTQMEKPEKFEPTTNIRFVSYDSILTHYTLALETQSKLEAIALDLQSKQNYFQTQLQQKANNIETKAKQNIYVSTQSYEQDMQQFNNLQNTYAQQYAQYENDAAQQAAILQQALNDSIQNYITLYNNKKKYDAILLSNAAAIYNPNLDITGEIVEGLNKRYNPTNAPAAAKPADAAAKGDKKAK